MDMQEVIQFIKKQGITAYEIAQKTPLTEVGVNKILNGQTKKPHKSTIEALTNYVKTHNLYITKNNEVGKVSYNLMEVPHVPIHAQAGFLSGYGDQAYMDELPKQFWEVDREYKGHYVCFEVKGDSMDDNSSEAILEGDKVLCREIQRHHWQYKLHINQWNFVIVHKDEGIIIKRITDHDVEKGVVTCHSLNPYYDDFKLNLNDVIALFNVVDLKRSLRL
ncbi:Peptidase S24-like [Sinomicrobium oceani]|uniref:Peptidase S24-like n=1 Tax=Sinomicrobium oceani TaxID=1150368 RepID=A0A1K1LKA8_9FLAO|nr:S24 family peptidase [Sinomicrobium oceani]SFW11303.1 Peptidase S24-like [Sinomicrobium oceani]